MKIENGFGRFTVNEEVDVDIQGIGYTVNKKPYLRCKKLSDGQAFNVNINDKHKTLKGKYKLICTHVSETNFPYVDFEKLEHESWKTHDKVELDQQVNEIELPEDDVVPIFGTITSEDIKECLKLTHQYREKLLLKKPCIMEHVKAIEDELCKELGRAVIEAECE